MLLFVLLTPKYYPKVNYFWVIFIFLAPNHKQMTAYQSHCGYSFYLIVFFVGFMQIGCNFALR